MCAELILAETGSVSTPSAGKVSIYADTTAVSQLKTTLDDGTVVTQIDDKNTVTISGTKTFATQTKFGDPGFETTGVSLAGVTQNAPVFKSDVVNTYNNSAILHEHSTTSANIILGVRSNSDTSSHTTVTTNQALLTLKAGGWGATSYEPAAQIDLQTAAAGTFSDTSMPGKISFKTSANAAIVPTERLALDSTSLTSTVGFVSNAATTGIGYATGAGGAVTQATSKVTAFTLSKCCGTIQFAADSLAANTSSAGAVWTNTAIAANDIVVFTHSSGGTLGAYNVICAPGAGTATIYIRNLTAGALAEAPIFRFAIIKGVVA